MNKYIIWTVLGILAISLGVAAYLMFGSKPSSDQNTQPVNNTTQNQETQAVQENTVVIENFSFSPSELVVKKGTKITWINNDSASHTIKSDAFQSGDLSNGGKYEFTFENTGTFSYICSIHPSMKGKITVE